MSTEGTCSTYFDEEFPKPLGLDLETVSAVIAPEQAKSSRECMVNGCPGRIFRMDGSSNLCRTCSPEIRCVLEYDPEAESEEDMLRMAESVPARGGSGE